MRLRGFIRLSLFAKPWFYTTHSELFELAIVYTECITNLRIRVIDTDPRTSTPSGGALRVFLAIKKKGNKKVRIKMLCDRCAHRCE